MVDPLDPFKPETLAAARKARSVTRIELAERSGISQATISRIEAGKSGASMNSWGKLATTLASIPVRQPA
jgi:transcriptional regulator with XRE-family HTH domain